MTRKWLLAGVLTAVGLAAAAETAVAQVGFGRGFNYNPYSSLPPGFYQGFYYGVPGTPYVRFRGNYSGPGGSGLPAGQNQSVDQVFRDTPAGTGMGRGAYGDQGTEGGA